jgi:hypothetical protein
MVFYTLVSLFSWFFFWNHVIEDFLSQYLKQGRVGNVAKACCPCQAREDWWGSKARREGLAWGALVLDWGGLPQQDRIVLMSPLFAENTTVFFSEEQVEHTKRRRKGGEDVF